LMATIIIQGGSHYNLFTFRLRGHARSFAFIPHANQEKQRPGRRSLPEQHINRRLHYTLFNHQNNINFITFDLLYALFSSRDAGMFTNNKF